MEQRTSFRATSLFIDKFSIKIQKLLLFFLLDFMHTTQRSYIGNWKVSDRTHSYWKRTRFALFRVCVFCWYFCVWTSALHVHPVHCTVITLVHHFNCLCLILSNGYSIHCNEYYSYTKTTCIIQVPWTYNWVLHSFWISLKTW